MSSCYACTAPATCRCCRLDLCDLHVEDQSILSSQFPMTAPAGLVVICREWHGGQSSSMYSILSTGLIANESTLWGLETELRVCLRHGEIAVLRRWLKWCE